MSGNDSISIHYILQWLANNPVLLLGFVAQGLFFGRFLIQWIASEKQGKSVVPLAFWYLSIFGGGLLLAYAIIKRDPVFIFGQAGGLFIYCRNLYLIHRERSKKKEDRSDVPEISGTRREAV